MLLERIRYYIETAKQGSFSKAAKNMFISPQAMTKQITLLEEELGGKLLERTTQGVELTPLGEFALHEFEELNGHFIHSIERVQHRAQQNDNVINIGIFSGYPHTEFVMPVISFLITNFPQYQIKFQLVDVLEGRRLFLEDQLDLLLTYAHAEEGWPDSHYLAFSSMPVKVFVSLRHPWVMKDEITLDDMREYDFIKMASDYFQYAVPKKESFYANIPCKRIIEVSNSDTLYAMLQQGTAFSVFPLSFHTKGEHLKAFDYPGEALTYHKSIVYKPKKALIEMVEQLKEEFGLSSIC